MRATITATGNIPMPKPLPKPPKLKIVSDWKPAIWDAEYRLEAYHDGTLNRMRPGFVIAHSCGLSLVHPSESGELGVTEHGANEDIRQGWLVTHTASGKGFGLTLNFKRATDALLLAASFAVDWTRTWPRSQPIPNSGGLVTACRRHSPAVPRRTRPNDVCRIGGGSMMERIPNPIRPIHGLRQRETIPESPTQTLHGVCGGPP